VDVSTGDEITIDRCEPNRHRVPAAWTNAKVGEPASVARRFTNYLLADPDSLMHEGAHEEFLNQVPRFPRIHGFYKVNKVVQHGVKVPAGWEKGLKEMNSDLGASKQVDVTLVVTKMTDQAFADAVEVKWMYGPKNSVIIVTGSDGEKLTWVKVVSLSRVERLKIELRDQLKDWPLEKADEGVALIRKLVGLHFERTPMAEWEYLASAAKPSTGMLVFLYILALVGTGILGVVMHMNDVFGDERMMRFRKRRGRF